MSSTHPRTIPAPLRRALVAVAGGLMAATTLAAPFILGPAEADGSARPATRQAANVVTPGDFTGYGFDQCLAPDQASMDRWLQSSPFLAVGIYIAGDSRACRSQ